MLNRLLAALGLAALVAFPAAAQETRSFTAANGSFEIPVAPQRIVSLNDQILTLPLWELGAPVVGSAGRLDAAGNRFLRGGMDTLGIDFANTDIRFVGLYNDLDIEAIAALEPDLILGGAYTDSRAIEALQAIAPTLVIDNAGLGLVDTLRTLADATGRSGSFDSRFSRYEANVARTKAYLGDTSGITATLTFMFPAGEELWVYRENLGAISRVLADLGIAPPPAVAALPERQASWSAELIEDLDADYVFGFYRQQPDATPEAVRAAYEDFAPGWCAALGACRDGRFILLPGPTFGGTLASLDLALEMVETHLAGRVSAAGAP